MKMDGRLPKSSWKFFVFKKRPLSILRWAFFIKIKHGGECMNCGHRWELVATVLKKSPIFLLGIIAMSMVSGCASTSTFTAYPKKINPLISDLQTRKAIDVTQCLKSECKSNDMILYNMERGRIAQITGQPNSSMLDFSASMDSIKANEQKATISVSGIGAQLAAVATNDNAIPYEGEGYERVMLHHFQAMNYLAKKDLEGAGVEIRLANSEQEESMKRHQKELDKAEDDAKEKAIDSSKNNAIHNQFAQLDEVAGKVKNSFQNAYTFYLSGFVYELSGQSNDAYIDYKKALEIFPTNTVLQKDVVRLARKLDMAQELSGLNLDSVKKPAAILNTEGELLVLFEDGFAPQKQEVKIPLPVPKVGLIAIAFPIYKTKWIDAKPLLITQGNVSLGCTETICNINALAVKSLKERIPALAIRQTVRAVAKGAAAKVASDKLGLLGTMGTTLWNMASENADLRSWVTLPGNAQIMRVNLSAGTHKLTVRQEGSLATADVDVDIKKGGKTILHVVRAENQIYSSALNF
jgi:uncharacterized protein